MTKKGRQRFLRKKVHPLEKILRAPMGEPGRRYGDEIADCP